MLFAAPRVLEVLSRASDGKRSRRCYGDDLGFLTVHKAVQVDHFSAIEIMDFSAVCRFARSKGALKKPLRGNAPADAMVTILGSSGTSGRSKLTNSEALEIMEFSSV